MTTKSSHFDRNEVNDDILYRQRIGKEKMYGNVYDKFTIITEKSQNNLQLLNPKKYCGAHLNSPLIPLQILIKNNVNKERCDRIYKNLQAHEKTLPKINQRETQTAYQFQRPTALQDSNYQLLPDKNQTEKNSNTYPSKTFFNGQRETVYKDQIPETDYELFSRLTRMTQTPKQKFYVPMTSSQQIGWHDRLQTSGDQSKFSFLKKSCKETIFAKSYYRLYKASLFSNKFK